MGVVMEHFKSLLLAFGKGREKQRNSGMAEWTLLTCTLLFIIVISHVVNFTCMEIYALWQGRR